MKRCLCDYQLWLMAENAGEGADWAHLAVCDACIARSRQLEHDLDVLTSALSQAPPHVRWPHRRSRRSPWMTAAALAAIVALISVGLWRSRSASTGAMPPASQDVAVWPFLGEVSYAVFVTNDDEITREPNGVLDVTDLQAALGGEQPCEMQASFFRPECGDRVLFLLAGGQ